MKDATKQKSEGRSLGKQQSWKLAKGALNDISIKKLVLADRSLQQACAMRQGQTSGTYAVVSASGQWARFRLRSSFRAPMSRKSPSLMWLWLQTLKLRWVSLVNAINAVNYNKRARSRYVGRPAFCQRHQIPESSSSLSCQQ